jgi:ATP-dependent Zn protease
VLLLKDLSGYGDAKNWGLELAQDMDQWRNGTLKWDDVDHRAVVLCGAPGTGKTSFAKVLANTLRVPLIATSVAEWNGRSNLSGTIKRMEEVFGKALAQAPCVLFVDELDGIANRNTLDDRYVEYWTQIINRALELVTEAMGKEGVILVGATNHVDRIDPALLRSGRLDQVIRIGLPDAEAIADILSRYIGGGVAKMDLASLAPQLVGRSGADIEKLVRDARAAARRAGRPFSVEDLQSQLPDPMKGLSPQTRRRISVYRKGQRLVAQVLGLAELTINEQHHDLRRLLAPGLSGERFPTQQLCDDVLTVIMAGRAAEEIVFGDVSVYGSGAPDSDLAAATAIAGEMELKAGFGEVGTIYLGEFIDAQALAPAAISSIRRRVDAALARASSILLDNMEELEQSNGKVDQGTNCADYLRLLN